MLRLLTAIKRARAPFKSTAKKYAFTAQIEVPTIQPNTASNAFFFQMGYNASTTMHRKGAMAFQAA